MEEKTVNHPSAAILLEKAGVQNQTHAIFSKYMDNSRCETHWYVQAIGKKDIITSFRTDSRKNRILLTPEGEPVWRITENFDTKLGITGTLIVAPRLDAEELVNKVSKRLNNWIMTNDLKFVYHPAGKKLPGLMAVTVSYAYPPPNEIGVSEMDYVLTDLEKHFPMRESLRLHRPGSTWVADEITLRREELKASIINRMLLGIDPIPPRKEEKQQ
jgi:hypothetical protein